MSFLLALLALQQVVVDVSAEGKPVPCRIHLKNPDGKPVKPPGFPAWFDHVVVSESATLQLPAGEYTYEVERGPEWSAARGVVRSPGSLKAELRRLVDLAAEGWWSGDVHIHRPPADVPLLARAEDLRIAPVITWWNQKRIDEPGAPMRAFDGRFARFLEGEDERAGGALLYFNLDAPLLIQKAAYEAPSPVVFLEEARKQPRAHIDIEKPFWWDAPTWIATGKTHTLGIANNHLTRSGMLDAEAWGKPRDRERFPAPHGNGLWTQFIYYTLLDAGLRVPPSAGSASGVLPNPVGYNRVYVQLDGPLDWDRWWEGLRAGRSFVGNGPLLRARAEGRWPGHAFDGAFDGEIVATLDGREPVSKIDLVVNGKVERSVPATGRTISLGRLRLERGWFLVRAVADVPETFRFASTGPWYVGPPRSSRRAARFFLDWVNERMARIKVANPAEREEVLRPHLAAVEFWKNLAERATEE